MASQVNAWENERIKTLDERWEPLAPGVDRFRLPGNEPVRRIITGRRTAKVGAFWSWKNDAHVAHESTGEEWFARILEVHPSVTGYFGQPEQIRVTVEGQSRPVKYTPDFLVMMGFRELRVEYKRFIDIAPPATVDPRDELGRYRSEKAAKMRRRLRLVRDAYLRCGIAWRLVTDRDLAAMASKATVDEIVANAGRPVTEEDADRLVAFLAARPARSATMLECCEQLHDSEFPRGDVLARIPELVLSIDLHARIDDETAVTLTRAVQ
ncbi:MAG: hypothetical protein JWR51_3314 [Devosia sp.]|uniref:hypothetical protein n=1 Tax=Devosia sp. TaxID=1871048 RepID=UPI0026362489|nr:hypothetical protein [Devosia sp.]MDB5530211.1 hypothetical protein [Devosia sp.]